MRRSLKAMVLAASLALASCGGSVGGGEDNNPPNSQPPTLLGAISGRVFSSYLAGNEISYEPYASPDYDFNNSAYVHVVGKNNETTTSPDGTFLLNNVPTGVWEIEAKTEKISPFTVPKDSATVLVAGNALSVMSGLYLITEPIMKGYAKFSNGTPYVGQIDLHSKLSSGCLPDVGLKDSTTTDSDGNFAFLRRYPGGGDLDRFCIYSPTNDLKFKNSQNGDNSIYIPFAYDIADEDIIVQ